MGSTFVRKVEQIVAASPLVVFSKTTCGYCSRGREEKRRRRFIHLEL